MVVEPSTGAPTLTVVRYRGAYLIVLLGVAVTYFVTAKLSLAVASINPSATPVWPPSGLALAVILLGGYRLAPAIFIGAFLANLTTNGSILTSAAIGAGNTIECLVGACLINRWSDGVNTFDTPAGVGRFAAICLFPSTTISATVGVGSLLLGGYALPADVAKIWLTWWMGDLGGALIVAPVIILVATSPTEWFDARVLLRAALAFSAAAIIGLVSLSPSAPSIPNSGALGFLVIGPLMWCALYQNQRDTAIAAFIVACFAVWGTMAGTGPFTQSTLNDSFLLLLAFMISISVPSLALSAHQAIRTLHEERIHAVMRELSHRTKNLLSVMQSMARQLGRRANSFDSFQVAFSERISALSKAHDLLVACDWQGADIGDLIREQLSLFGEPADGRVVIKGPPVRLRPRAVEQISMALHELATNATKYGALSVEQGRAVVAWREQTNVSGQAELHLEWIEEGGPQVVEPSRQGFGHMVLTELVPRSLNGRMTLDFHPGGLRWTLQVPMLLGAAQWAAAGHPNALSRVEPTWRAPH